MMKKPQTIFQKTQKGQRAYSLPKENAAWSNFLPEKKWLRSTEIALPEISEIDLTRHFSTLERLNMGIDTNFYPLGSCTMKLNPRICEEAAQLTEYKSMHPLASEEMVQGSLTIIYTLIEKLCKLCGMSSGTLAPNAGAQGEFVGIRMIEAYHKDRNDKKRTQILVPDSAHGTNPASARLCSYDVVTIRSDPETGDVDINHLKEKLSDKVAGFMLTNPNTIGVFSKNILQITKLVHDCGGLLYYDGANLNSILNLCRPGEMGFDVMHINLHKTFSTPHGGGGPGGAPVLCQEKLEPFLPTPRIIKEKKALSTLWKSPKSIGAIASFYGNFSVLLKAYLYFQLHGHYGLRKISEMAILNANYLKYHLSSCFKVPIKGYCMHEFVMQADKFLAEGIKAFDIAKRLLDYGIHAPTVYFPLIIKECMLIEPTESESKKTLDRFIAVMKKIIDEAQDSPQLIKDAPHQMPLQRLDEVHAARVLDLVED
ncbi:MAG: putative glycine dehydrogenase (decarboxylating) subunit 2 [Chlamydiae bacterium]|nr:putative glycine dehydrogenase (decarboxylating) subunit 2 [Chlamydiota bacterium]